MVPEEGGLAPTPRAKTLPPCERQRERGRERKRKRKKGGKKEWKMDTIEGKGQVKKGAFGLAPS